MNFLLNSDVWRFLCANDLCVCIRERNLPKGRDWYAYLKYSYGGSATFRDGSCLSGAYGEGGSPEKAFDDMVRKYSGRLLVFEYWEPKFDGKDTKVYKPKEITFPIIINEANNNENIRYRNL